MKCRVCGGNMEPQVTDLPFKLSNRAIVIVRDLPVLQCSQCAEYVIEDPIKKRVEDLLEKVDPRLELEVVGFSAKERSEDHIYEKVEKALKTFFIKDRNLLSKDVNERSITHKVAEYLQYQFPDMNVDCEYNRRGNHGEVKKTLFSNRRVFPDIVIHKRGNKEENLVVIEAKKKGRSSLNDREKLEEFTNPNSYGYKVGLFLAFDVGEKRISEVSIYKGGNEEKADKKWKSLIDLVDPVLFSGQLSEEPS